MPEITLDGTVLEIVDQRESSNNIGIMVKPEHITMSPEAREACRELELEHIYRVPITICDDGDIIIHPGDRVRVYSKERIYTVGIKERVHPVGLGIDTIEVLDEENNVRATYHCQ